MIGKAWGLERRGEPGTFIERMLAVKVTGKIVTEIIVSILIISLSRKEIRELLVCSIVEMFFDKFSNAAQISSLDSSNSLK
ncbi:MAG: hypothetical protein BWY03_00570 [Parcubacteria group bacterium ADurb.Bin159]|nr:MAG: hypothetical protein BWY03_00570 [Parcubacteria group bacterium ADurb.Bin159]